MSDEQKPVAWMSPGKERLEFSRADTVYGSHTIPLYTHPAPDVVNANDFHPDWDVVAPMVEHQQRMAERIQEIDAVVAQLVDTLRAAQSVMHGMEHDFAHLWVVDETPESLDLIERKIAAALAAAKEAGL